MMTINDVVKKYSLLQLKSAYTEDIYETWFRQDMLFFIEKCYLTNKFRILPNASDISNIDFTEHYYEDFEDAVKIMINLKTEK